MGLFNKLFDKHSDSTVKNEIQKLLEVDFKYGEFTLHEKLWGYFSKYNYQMQNRGVDFLELKGEINCDKIVAKSLINDFAVVLGLDGSGDGIWTEVEELGFNSKPKGVYRMWFFDKNFDLKPVDWVNESQNNFNQIKCVLEIKVVDDGIGFTIDGWVDLKGFIKNKIG